MHCSSCICPDVDCSPVLSCINSDLTKITTDDNPVLTNFCAAVSSCVDAQFEAISNGQSNSFDNFGFSIVKILQSLSGYSDSGDTYFYSADGVLGWTNISVGHTYINSGLGVTVTGSGTSGDPYIPTLNIGYTKSLFSATNGLTYTSGSTKLGGALTENTTITGGSTYDLNITGINDFILQSLGDTYLRIANYSGASSGDVLTLANSTNGLVTWSTPSSFSGSFIQNQQAVQQAANFRIVGSGYVGYKFVAGAGNQITDTSHYFKAQPGDLYPLVVHNSLGLELLALSTSYLKIPDGTINPVPALAAPYHEGSLYYNTATKDFLGYHSGIWSSFVLSSRSVTSQHSITGGGDLSIDRTLNLVNDLAIPGNDKYYGTDSSGTRGWYANSFGSVTSVGLSMPSIFTVLNSPVTSSGTFTVTLATQSANTIFAGPTTGVPTTPFFRTLVTADIPDTIVTLSKVQNITTQRLLGRTTAGSGVIEQLTVGQHLLLSGGVLNAAGRTLVNVSVFDSSGVWTKSGATNAVLVYVIGAGGGGGGVSGASSEAAAAGGGGGGGYTINYLTSGFGTSQTITVGSGGAGGLAGANDGSNGGSSSFGSLIQVQGGFGGTSMAHGTTPSVAPGGRTGAITATSGLRVGFGGSPGKYGLRLSNTDGISGASGSSVFNGEASGSALSQIGLSGNAYGAGGSGAFSSSGFAFAGGSGLAGAVIIYEFS